MGALLQDGLADGTVGRNIKKDDRDSGKAKHTTVQVTRLLS
jgi:hypothetical protein